MTRRGGRASDESTERSETLQTVSSGDVPLVDTPEGMRPAVAEASLLHGSSETERLTPHGMTGMTAPTASEFEARYLAKGEIASGGMGEVRILQDQVIGREVAGKFLSLRFTRNEDARASFLREACLQGRLEHPAVVPVHDVGLSPDGRPFFTTPQARITATLNGVDARARALHPERSVPEELEAISLRATAYGPSDRYKSVREMHAALERFLGDDRELAARRALAAKFVEEAEAARLQARHSRPELEEEHWSVAVSKLGKAIALDADQGDAMKRLVDLRMLGELGETYVLDWGIAKFLGKGDEGSADECTTDRLVDVRDEHVLMGTPGYMAPEQVAGAAFLTTHAMDIYALGAILFELLTLEPLNQGDSPEARISATLSGADARACTRYPERSIPVELEAICIRATGFMPRDRYRTVREMYDAIERFLDGERDLTLRRDLAARYLEQAEIAQREARRAAPEAAEKHWSMAIRNLGRAIALDSDQGQAMTRLIDLLLEGPRFKPEAVRQETAKAQDRNVRLPAVVMTLVLLSNLPAIPYFLWVGVRDWVSFGLLVTCIFTLLGLQLYTLLATRVGPMTRIASSAVAAVAVAVTSHMYGPLILTPLLLIGCVVTPSVDPNRRVRVHGLIFTLLAQLVPAALEWFQIGSRSYAFTTENWTIFPRMLSFSPNLTMLHLVIAVLVSTTAVAFGVMRFLRTVEAAEERATLHAWQLRQLVPNRSV